MHRTHPIPAYIALGSNLGDREQNLRRAIQLLNDTDGITVTTVSRFLENPSVGGPDDAPDFLNAAARLDTTLGSHALLHRLLEIEQALGRVRRQRWEPRLVDLDLLLYNDQIVSSQELVVPHPLMHERSFVLRPLAEIAPDLVHPTLQMTIRGLLDDLEQKKHALEQP
jgi:2-amino-4-hydroxy-6-hydroxymethyldihydropteridine diphosphokinase